MKAVLGLKLDPWHDTGAALVAEENRGLCVTAISQERLDREKHSRAFPKDAIDYCLSTRGMTLTDLSLVVADYIFAPSVDDTSDLQNPTSPVAKRQFFQELQDKGIPVVFAEHHLCHATSAYFATEWDEAAALVIDGHGSNYETQSIFHFRGNDFTKLASSKRPGIGWMYAAVTEQLLGFKHLQDGKTMGLAGWTRSGGKWGKAFSGENDTGNPCEIVYPQFANELARWEMIAPAGLRRRRADDSPTRRPFPEYAYAAQAELEEGVVDLVRATAKLVASNRLCYSGGVALNIPANRLILDSGIYSEIFIQPAASDSGIPLGAALFGYHCLLRGAHRWKMEHAFLGRDYSEEEDTASKLWPGPRSHSNVNSVAALLAHDYLVAWFEGASEYGPRALGHRSILCAPRHPRMKDYLNREVKHREMFRPFAPIVPQEVQADYFDLDVPSPFMLINCSAHPKIAELIPAVVHADGTARVQSISANQQPRLHAVLQEVGSLTGVPVLLNTSLNLAGEPIVETPAQAVDLLARSRLDALVTKDFLLTKIPLQQMLDTPNPGLHGVQTRGAKSGHIVKPPLWKRIRDKLVRRPGAGSP